MGWLDKGLGLATGGLYTTAKSGLDVLGMTQTDYVPPGGSVDTARADEERRLALEARERQLALAGMLERQAAGQGSSVAEQQLARGRDASIQQAMAMQAGARGGNAALASRQAQQAQAAISQQAAGQAAVLRAQEQAQTRQELAGVLGGVRTGDITSRTVSAGEAGANLEAMLAQQKMQADIEQQNTANVTQVLGAIAGSGGTVGAAALKGSDVRLKERRRPVSDDDLSRIAQLSSQMDAGGYSMRPRGPAGPERVSLTPREYAAMMAQGTEWRDVDRLRGAAERQSIADIIRERQGYEPGVRRSMADPRLARWAGPIEMERYRYKPSAGGGEYVGPNAQAVARSPDPAVANLVERRPDGKLAIDGGRAGVMALGFSAEQQKRIDALQAQLDEELAKLRRTPIATRGVRYGD